MRADMRLGSHIPSSAVAVSVLEKVTAATAESIKNIFFIVGKIIVSDKDNDFPRKNRVLSDFAELLLFSKGYIFYIIAESFIMGINRYSDKSRESAE